MKLGKVDNKTGSKVEAHVASCPVLSLFRREEPKDGDTGLPYTLHNYIYEVKMDVNPQGSHIHFREP